MSKITTLAADAADTGYIRFTTEDGESIEAPVIASDAGCTIINHDRGDRWVALQVIDYGDGDAEVIGCREDDTFDCDYRGQYVVRRTDNAGSLKWEEA